MLIGLTGPAGCGKTTVADALTKASPPAYCVSFAQRVKEIATECFGWDGVKDDKGRRLLQVIGTEAGREYDRNIWVNHLLRKIPREHIISVSRLVIIDDVRFDNDAAAIFSNFGKVFRLVGRSTNLGDNAKHSSEAGISDDSDIIVIDNSGTLDQTIKNIRSYL